ncbi:MAG: lysophospholipid acyltransferase family protein [Myxococcales bacterium]|nr:lysophospholipid acyltransferase family protein [Myxococcales bacterium]MBL0197290.1 lysophospholipid acyltransferase family protein [Myxococcales bacterium]
MSGAGVVSTTFSHGRTARVTAAALGWFFGAVLRVRRRHVERALRRAGLELPAMAVYRELARHVVDLVGVALSRNPTLVAFGPHARAALERARARGPVVIAASHTGNWELAAFALATLYPVSVVAKRQGVGLADRFARGLRARFGVAVIEPRGAFAWASAALRAGRVVAMAIDQVPDRAEHGEPCPFLGAEALVDRAPFVLARRTGAAVLVAVCEGGEVRVLGEVSPDDPRAAARAATALLERHVLAHPASWLWLHRRWRRPPPRRGVQAAA